MGLETFNVLSFPSHSDDSFGRISSRVPSDLPFRVFGGWSRFDDTEIIRLGFSIRETLETIAKRSVDGSNQLVTFILFSSFAIRPRPALVVAYLLNARAELNSALAGFLSLSLSIYLYLSLSIYLCFPFRSVTLAFVLIRARINTDAEQISARACTRTQRRVTETETDTGGNESV